MEVTSAKYEEALTQFHHALKSRETDGFIDCYCVKLQSFPWRAPESKGYEDWYLVEDFRSLGILNETAVSHAFKESHDRVASLSKGGAGGIYRRYGKRELDEIVFSAWFAKPLGMSYQDLDRELTSMAEVTCYWQRQMVLGPAPEFCVHSSRKLSLPASFRAFTLRGELL